MTHVSSIDAVVLGIPKTTLIIQQIRLYYKTRKYEPEKLREKIFLPEIS